MTNISQASRVEIPCAQGYIAIIVLVAVRLVESGDWKELAAAKGTVKRGKKIVGHNLSNKGAVGIAFRFHDSTIALVGCHMTSDKKGKSKLMQRHADTRSVLEGMEMGYETLGFELPLCCHHVILVGDMNYRIDLPPTKALEHMEQQAWNKLLASDELSNAMASGEVLADWIEPSITFLPSYRRVPGMQATATPPLSNVQLRELYTLEVGGGGERTPSYTDRILTHSMADMRDQLRESGQYSSAEGMTLSDHRPISIDLELRTQRRGAVFSRFASRALAQVQRTHRVRCHIELTQLQVVGAAEETEPQGRASLVSASLTTSAAATCPSHHVSTSSENNPPTMAPRAASTVAAISIAFPMPAEDPDFSLTRLAHLLGKRGSSAFKTTSWPLRPDGSGLVLVAELDAMAARAFHVLIQLLDAEGVSIAQGSLAILPPWMEPNDSSQLPAVQAMSSHRLRQGSAVARLRQPSAARRLRQCSAGMQAMLSSKGVASSAVGVDPPVKFVCPLHSRGARAGDLSGEMLVQWGHGASSQLERPARNAHMLCGRSLGVQMGMKTGLQVDHQNSSGLQADVSPSENASLEKVGHASGPIRAGRVDPGDHPAYKSTAL